MSALMLVGVAVAFVGWFFSLRGWGKEQDRRKAADARLRAIAADRDAYLRPTETWLLAEYAVRRAVEVAKRRHRIDLSYRRCQDCGLSELAIEAHTGLDRPVCVKREQS